MARYIDLEEYAKRINENIKPDTPEEKALIEWCKDECIRQAYAMPAADVVMRAELAIMSAKYAGCCIVKDRLEIEIKCLKIANEMMYEAFGRQAREILTDLAYNKELLPLPSWAIEELIKEYTE